jgi:hypothetical protein
MFPFMFAFRFPSLAEVLESCQLARHLSLENAGFL